MMTAAAILKAATDAGIAVRSDGDGLLLQSAAEPDAALVERIRSHKTEILEHLRGWVWSEEHWQALFEERAGIMEYDGGMSRKEAEAEAAGEMAHLRRGRSQQ